MSTATDLEYLIAKVSTIQKQLGGPTDTLLENRNKDEFNTIKLKLTETINEVSKKQEERDNAFNKNGRSVAVIRYGVEIQDGFTDLNTQLGQMKEALRRQRKNTKKYPESQIEIKQQQLEKYVALVSQLKAREEGETVDLEDKPISLMDMKINLMSNNKHEKKIDVARELNEIEEEAMKRFKKNDEEIDQMVGDVIVGLDGLKNKAEMMGEAIDKQEDAIEGLKVEIDKAHEGLVTSNARLKKILYQYRRPGKFCVDVLLILFLLGLIAVIVKLASG